MIRVVDSAPDLARCVEICNAVEPDDPVTLEQLQDASAGTFLLHEGGGYAFVGASSVPDSAFAMVRVRPDARGRGIGTSLLAAARERARELSCASLWGRARDADSLAFATRRGFEEVTREVTVLREVVPGDGERAAGIVELRDEHLREVYEVCAECIPEIHAPLPGEVPPYERWLAHEQRDSAAAFVALDGEVVAGYARLHRCGLPQRLDHGLTAVRRSHRRRGIATALKQAQIAWAAEHGYTELATGMVEGNAPMRALNERLGYRPLEQTFVVSGSAEP
jgi:GNAT superfamily N-acetyltransferase